ncbi:hypothetical protein [Litoreibacter roseus]|nr:hypothetical protein [Litoreibacter roseus]
MKHLINRWKIVLAAGAVAALAVAAQAMAQPSNLRGTVNFEGGAKIPEGQIAIYIDDPAIPDTTPKHSVTSTLIKSDGGEQAIVFSVPLPESSAASPTLQIIARLEREDGWLLARGSAQVEKGSSVTITLNTAMY